MSEWIDVSQRIRPGIPVWPGDVPYAYRATWTRGAGDSVNVGELTLSTHTGTHIDAPYHFDDRGAAAGDLDVNIFIGPALVVFLHHPERIEPSQFASVAFGGFSRLLVRTDSWEDLETFPDSLPPVDPELGECLSSKGIRLIGVDLPSVDPIDSQDLPAHRALDRHGIHILEGLVLRHVPPGPYDFIGVPLPLAGSDGSPVRAVVRRQHTSKRAAP